MSHNFPSHLQIQVRKVFVISTLAPKFTTMHKLCMTSCQWHSDVIHARSKKERGSFCSFIDVMMTWPQTPFTLLPRMVTCLSGQADKSKSRTCSRHFPYFAMITATPSPQLLLLHALIKNPSMVMCITVHVCRFS